MPKYEPNDVDPKTIAKMISEDPDEINPLDDITDEFEAELGFCDGCLKDIDYNFLSNCEICGYWWCEICEERRSGFDHRQVDLKNDAHAQIHISSCPNCAGMP